MTIVPHTVVSLNAFLKAARRIGLDEGDIQAIELLVAYEPDEGEIVVGTGGVRKRRIALPGRSKGKSGGARLFTVFFHTDAPAYIITIIDKADTGNLSKSEQNELAELVRTMKRTVTRR